VRIRDWVHADFGIDLAGLTEVRHGADVDALVWRGTTATGRSYAVKWGRAPNLPEALRAVPGVVAPLLALDGTQWTVRDGKPLSVTPWVSGVRALDGTMTEAHWRAYGTLLATVHATAPDGLPTERFERWTAAVAAVTDRLATHRDGDELTDALAAEWRAALGRITALVEQTERLGAAGVGGVSVCCHGDPHLGNVLLGDGDGQHGQVWLLDWDDAVRAPVERDLLFVLGGVLPFAQVTARQQEWFFAAYGPVPIEARRLAYFRGVRAMEDLAVPAAQLLDGHGDRAAALEIVRGVLSPTGLLRAALQN
jgi:spectinomycin phosphotransferase